MRYLSLVLLIFSTFLGANPYPAPWSLGGDGYIFISLFDKKEHRTDGFIPESMQDRYVASYSVMMLINYKDTPFGSYDELLYIPGNFKFMDGKIHPSITKLYLNSPESLSGARQNWGIPKEYAAFERQALSDTEEEITVIVDGQAIAKYVISSGGPDISISTFKLPNFLKTLGQELNGNQYVFALDASGDAQFATIESSLTNSDYFPDLKKAKTIIGLKVSNFRLELPVPEVMGILN